MSYFKLTLAVLLIVSLGQTNIAQSNSKRPWAPAVYHGLIMGKSTRADVFKALGKPAWSGPEEDTGVPIIEYDVSDPIPGSLIVYLRAGILRSMTLIPKNSLDKDDIIRLFGLDYLPIRFSSDDCLEKGGVAPSYEDSKGPMLEWEYRDRGLAAVFRHDSDDIVEAIVFTYKSSIRAHSACEENRRK